MKHTIILGFATAVLAFTSFSARADSQYPASDFEPKVIYLDKSVATTPTPASNAVPCTANTATTSTPAQPVADEFDPNYPAANFQPKVIYP